MPKVPVNEEHREAAQAESNRERDEFIATLSKADQEKFKAIEKAVRILVKADVLFYLFPQLPSFQYKGKKQIWQWNSLVAKTKFDEAGKVTDESHKEAWEFHEAFFAFFLNQFEHMIKGKTLEEKLTALPFFFHYCLTKHSAYLNEEVKE